MIQTTMVVSLVLSGVNWLVVLASVIVENMAAIGWRWTHRLVSRAAKLRTWRNGTQPDKVIDATGSLATAL